MDNFTQQKQTQILTYNNATTIQFISLVVLVQRNIILVVARQVDRYIHLIGAVDHILHSNNGGYIGYPKVGVVGRGFFGTNHRWLDNSIIFRWSSSFLFYRIVAGATT